MHETTEIDNLEGDRLPEEVLIVKSKLKTTSVDRYPNGIAANISETISETS